MIARSDLRFARLAVIGALVATLGLAGCGRKAGLDPPPSVATATPEGAPRPDPGSGVGPDGKPMAPPSGEKKWFFLDWLLD